MTIPELLVKQKMWPSTRGPLKCTDSILETRHILRAISSLERQPKTQSFYVNPTVAKYMGYDVKLVAGDWGERKQH